MYGCQVQAGDLYIHIAKPSEEVWGCVHEALQRGASAVICSEAFEAEEDLEVPVMLLPDCLDAQQRLAIAFYDNPSTKMTVVGVTGNFSCLSFIVRASNNQSGILQNKQNRTHRSLYQLPCCMQSRLSQLWLGVC